MKADDRNGGAGSDVSIADGIAEAAGARKLLSAAAWLFAAGALLFAIAAAAERMMFAGALELPARLVYRAAFWVMFPAHVVVRVLFHSDDRHQPLWRWAVAAFGAPYGYWLAWRFLRGYAAARTRLFAPPPPGARSVEAQLEAQLAGPGRILPESANEAAGSKQTPPPPALARREFMIKAGGAGAGTIAVGLGGFASLVEPQLLETRFYDLPIAGLPRALEGLRIAHISDTHYGPFTALSYLRAAIDRANALKPDVVFLTGDYVHRTPLAIEPGIKILTELKAKFGAVAVLGNHDHWEGADACRAAFANTAIPLIDNQKIFLGPGGLSDSPSSDAICVAGVGDLWEDEVLVEEALAGAPPEMPRLLLSHNPDVAETLGRDPRVDAVFSGHTHGGQVAFPGVGAMIVPSAYGRKYAGGVCAGPKCPVIVSRGVGMAVLPVRFRVPPEIGLITLRAAAPVN